MINKRRLELFRLAPIGRVIVKTVEVGSGEIRCGSYQFAIQFANSQNGESTKFSIFTNPISISDVSKSGVVSGTIGGKTNKSIVLSVSASSDEVVQYDVYRIAVIENTQGNPGYASNVSVSQFYNLDAQDFDFSYSANDVFNSVDLAEVSIDDAAIETFKTITIKNNKLVGGNVTYKNLKYDRGIPEVTFGSIVEVNVPVRQGFDKASSEVKGYFSGEVYRYAVSYWDEYGNFSVPSALDMSNVSGNISSNSGFKDMKFPVRSNGSGDLIRTINGVTNIVARGLKLSIVNHPTWAKGMVILRAERKKDILFQTPLIPTTVIQSPNANFNYPGDDRKLPSVFGTIAPKNLLKSNNQGIIRDSSSATKANVEYRENYDKYEYCKRVHVAFPPEYIYNNATVPYSSDVLNANLILESIDYASLRPIKYSNLNSEVTDSAIGTTIESSVHVTFAAVNQDDYASGSKSSSIIKNELSASRPIIDEVSSFDLVAEGQDKLVVTSIGVESPTSYFGAYDDLKISPDGEYNGYAPTNQKCAVIVTKSMRPDPTANALTSPIGAYIASATLETNNGRVESSNMAIDSTKNRNSLNISEANQDEESPRHYIEIVNVRKGLNDDRYGDPYSIQIFIPTGSVYSNNGNFLLNEAITLDVFGGDCYISPFTFKVHDSVYGISAVTGGGNYDYKEWGGEDFTSTNEGAPTKRPVPYRSVSACIGVYLESEVNGYIEDKLVYKNTNNNSASDSSPIGWSNNSITKGQVVSYLGKFYYTLKDVGGDDFPGKLLDLDNITISNIGFSYLDFGSNYDNTIYPNIEDSDLFLSTNSYRESRVGFQYLYNPNYSVSNKSKFFVTTGGGDERNRVSFDSRLVYSDTKILQTNVEGFSRFRLLNFYDLEESKGAITKILSNKGKMIAIQENAFAYVPFEASIIEAQDGVQLAVRSSEIIGIPQYIEDYGSRYIRSCISSPFGVYFADVDNSSIVNFSEGLMRINDLKADETIKELSAPFIDSQVVDQDIVFYQDPRSTRLVMKFGNKALSMSQDNKIIHGVIKHNDLTGWSHGIYANSEHFVFGWNVNVLSPIGERDTAARQFFTMSNFDVRGSFNSPFGPSGGYTSFVKNIINHDYLMPKVLDVVKINANKSTRHTLIAFAQDQNRAQYGFNPSDPRYPVTSIPDRGEAWFLINKIREDEPIVGVSNFNPKRLRGEHFELISILSGNTKLTSLVSKYRISDRRI